MKDCWSITTFDELIKKGLLVVNDGYRAKLDELGGNGLIFLRAGCVTDSHIDFSGTERFHDHLSDRVAGKTSRPFDVMVTTKGNSIGRTAYVRSRMPDFVYSPHLSFWRSLHPNELIPLFLHCWSRGPEFARQLAGLGHGTDMAPYLSLADQRKMRLSLPPPVEQKAIGSLIGALDDKIDCNRRMNDLLLNMVRVLYQHWFVDFGPFQKRGLQDSDIGPIPKGWAVRSLHESARYVNGAAFKEPDFSPNGTGLPVIKISELKGGITDQTRWCVHELDPRYRMADGDILFSWSGSPETSIDIFLWAAGRAWLNQHTFRVVPHRPIERPFVFSLLKHLKPVFVRLASNKQTTGLGHVTAGDMKRLMVVVPPDDVLAQFNEHAGPWLDQMLANLKENQLLARTRDYLLPKLLSGEVEVKVAKKEVEAIA